jgi:protein-S-isoprenylcysteine O-methyltransferase Ste14
VASLTETLKDRLARYRQIKLSVIGRKFGKTKLHREKDLQVSRIAVVVWTISRVVAAVLVAGWAALHLRLLDRVIGLGLPEWLKPAGMALLLVGGAVVLLCGGMLNTPGIIPTKFVVVGPFRYVRNPMSLGGVAMMLGLALFCRSISILLFSAILFLVLHGIVVLWEESFLEKRYGESYLQYKHSVNRWLPIFRPRLGSSHP